MTREAAIRLYLFYSEIYLHFVFKVIESSSAVPGWRKDLILEEEVKIPIVCNTFPSTASSPPGPPPHGWTGNYGGTVCPLMQQQVRDIAPEQHRQGQAPPWQQGPPPPKGSAPPWNAQESTSTVNCQSFLQLNNPLVAALFTRY